MTLEFQLPSDQAKVLAGFVTTQTRVHPVPCASWTDTRTVAEGARSPVIRQGGGVILVAEAVWGHRDLETGDLEAVTSPEGKQFAWPCLIPMTDFRSTSEAGGLLRGTLVGNQGGGDSWFMVGGVWRPADRRNAESFTAFSKPNVQGDAGANLLVIDHRYWLDWIDPQKDNRWLYARP